MSLAGQDADNLTARAVLGGQNLRSATWHGRCLPVVHSCAFTAWLKRLSMLLQAVIITGDATVPLEPHRGPRMCTFPNALHPVVSVFMLISIAVGQMAKQKKKCILRHGIAESSNFTAGISALGCCCIILFCISLYFIYAIYVLLSAISLKICTQRFRRVLAPCHSIRG